MSLVSVEVVISSPGAAPIRHAFRKVVTTIGADASADVRIETVSRQWAIVKRQGDSLELRLLESGDTHALPAGGVLELDGVRFDRRPAAPDGVAVVEGGQVIASDVASGLGAPRLPVDRIALALGDAERVDDALRGLLDELLRATGADRGALLLREQGAYSVPVARDASGADLEHAEELLSDTLVRDVLASGEAAFVHDAPKHERYAEIPSVASLDLRTMLCAPMTLGGQVLGAIFLGKRQTRTALQPAWADDLRAIGSMVLPLVAQLRRHAAGRGEGEFLLVGEHPTMEEVRRLVQKVGPSDLSVLVLGDTGTGKEMVARALHAASPRRDRPMIALNCSAVPEPLLGGELFGAKKGAYTGAVSDRPGVIERADGSTLFLDEVGDMPPAMQAMLLRVLEDRRVTRLGDGESRSVDFRLVAATHKDLHAEVEAGRFRQDLLFRLQELTIGVPALCERGEDVLLLASLFLRRAERELGLPPLRLSPAAERAILAHRWPGNVRELRAAMRRAALLCEGDAISPSELRLGGTGSRSSAPPALDLPLAEAREKFVRDYVIAALARHDDNREATAAALGISLRTLYRYLE